MEASRQLCGFIACLEPLVSVPDATAFERTWSRLDVQARGSAALAVARRPGAEALARALAELDRRLLDVLTRARTLPDPHVTTFRIPELERWQHAAAAALVGARWGVAGLRTVVADTKAPVARRYYAFLGLAERHPQSAWPLFQRYLLTPGAHHAFVAVAVEATRYYQGKARVLVELFTRIRGDQMLRRFLGPKILESLYVMGDPVSLPLFEELLVTGHTAPHPDRCEITRALVAVRKLTGRVSPSSKFGEPEGPRVGRVLDEAERLFERERDQLTPVVVI